MFQDLQNFTISCPKDGVLDTASKNILRIHQNMNPCHSSDLGSGHLVGRIDVGSIYSPIPSPIRALEQPTQPQKCHLGLEGQFHRFFGGRDEQKAPSPRKQERRFASTPCARLAAGRYAAAGPAIVPIWAASDAGIIPGNIHGGAAEHISSRRLATWPPGNGGRRGAGARKMTR